MHIVGSIIARIGSKRLSYKNILPFQGKPLVGLGIEKLREIPRIDQIVVSTESELIARVAKDFGATVLKRPSALAQDNVPSVPVFQHILSHFPCDIHVNYNINFPICPNEAIENAIELCMKTGESLSVPYAVWAQSKACLESYGDPWNITATRFNDERILPVDIHYESDLLKVYQETQGALSEWAIHPGHASC